MPLTDYGSEQIEERCEAYWRGREDGRTVIAGKVEGLRRTGIWEDTVYFNQALDKVLVLLQEEQNVE